MSNAGEGSQASKAGEGSQASKGGGQGGRQQGGRKGERSPYDEYREMAQSAATRQQERFEASKQRFEASTGIRLKYALSLQQIDAELQAARRRATTSFTQRLESVHQQRLDQERRAYEEYLKELGSDGDDREKRLYDASLKLLRHQVDAAYQEQSGYGDAQAEYLTALREAEAPAQEKAWQEAAECFKQLLEVEA
ncbi:hypothetical protein EAS64_01165 [Trebonia kvetii]|uniref:Uncharacterized protein n=1 Tax=Trebonia kvetii TaxID=2480626 RepID=A0A6P2C6G3_9ACTN|nr:hypothetical protein [Trebonia kvetii]TVZ06095.1 hypothetical protein EAS64_01165 [Trebonia kvetii]